VPGTTGKVCVKGVVGVVHVMEKVGSPVLGAFWYATQYSYLAERGLVVNALPDVRPAPPAIVQSLEREPSLARYSVPV
jgi:hypothetical protein